MPRNYPQSFKDRAVRMLVDRLEADESLTRSGVLREIAQKLGIAPETLRRWRSQAEIDTGTKPGVTTEAQAEIRKLKRENTELGRANEILKTALAFFAAELDRPTTR